MTKIKVISMQTRFSKYCMKEALFVQSEMLYFTTRGSCWLILGIPFRIGGCSEGVLANHGLRLLFQSHSFLKRFSLCFKK